MTQLARRGSLVAALLLLVSAATAYAECAWVLWGQTPALGGFMFLPSDAFKTREECHAEKARRDEKMKADIKREGRSTGIVLFSCLPDTVDPRGPKAK